MEQNPTMDLLTGVPNSMLQSPQVEPTLRRNQERLYRFLTQHSPYFRRHRERKKKVCQREINKKFYYETTLEHFSFDQKL